MLQTIVETALVLRLHAFHEKARLRGSENRDTIKQGPSRPPLQIESLAGRIGPEEVAGQVPHFSL